MITNRKIWEYKIVLRSDAYNKLLNEADGCALTINELEKSGKIDELAKMAKSIIL